MKVNGTPCTVYKVSLHYRKKHWENHKDISKGILPVESFLPHSDYPAIPGNPDRILLNVSKKELQNPSKKS